jgi:hypothetical protein
MAVRREIASHHEAAHAVIARVQGVEVVGVLMFRTDETTPSSVFSRSAAYHAGADTAARIAGLEMEIRIALAGPIANALYGKDRSSRKVKESEIDDRARSDSMAVEIALLMAGKPIPQHHDGIQLTVDRTIIESANVVITRLWEETKALLVEHWPAVQRVAEALMTCDLLDQAELDRLMQNRKAS